MASKESSFFGTILSDNVIPPKVFGIFMASKESSFLVRLQLSVNGNMISIHIVETFKEAL